MKKKSLNILDKVSLLALVLAVVITVTCVLVPGKVIAAWDGTAAASFNSGSGTASSPYIIATPAQMGKFLLGLSDTVTYEGQYFALGGNIDMTGGTWDLTGTTFSGTLDGRGYTVTADCPFLGNIGASGTVRGLNYVCTTDVSRSVLSVYNNGTVCGCVVKGNVSGGTTSGLICDQNYGTVQSCGGVGTLSAYGPKEYDAEAGMIAINSGTVKNCYAAVTVSASAPGKYDTAYSGPVVGKSSSGTVTDCVYDSTLYTYSVANATGLPTADMKNGGALSYLGSTMPDYCGWTTGSAFGGYPELFHLAHNYTAYVSGYVGKELTVYNTASLSIGFAKVSSNGTIYYSTDPSVTDPGKFTAYSAGTISISGDTTVSMAVKYNGEFGAVTRQRFVSLPGGGTESNPYQISENYQLWLPELFPTAHFVLTKDLTFTSSDYATTGAYPGGWDPIASFTGSFNGQGYAIYGLKGSRGGLFENIGNGGTVKNLRIIDHRLVGPGRLGAVADSNNGGTVSHCYTKSAFTLSDLPSFGSSSQVATVGGVVGYSYGTVEYCRNDGIVYATTTMGSSSPHIGGIVGDGGDIRYCVNTGDLVYGNAFSNNYADYVFMGGIAGLGRVENSKAVQNMYINDGTDYSPYVAGISAWYSTGYADSCVADFTLYKNATFGGGVGQYAYCTNTSYKCYNAETAQLPADCEELTFGYGGNWWVSNEGVMPQGVIDPDGHAWSLKSGGQILPNCTAKGDACLQCAICGEGSGSVDHLETISALGHRYTSYTSNNDATCQADGTKTAQCDRGCGATETVTDEGSKTDCSFTVVSDSLATAATCKDAATYYAACATCGTVSNTVTLPVGDPDVSAHTFENGICSRCMLPEGLQYIVEDGFVTVIGYTGSLTELPIPASIEGKKVKTIGERAFENCTFTTVALPEGLTAIGRDAFIACGNLTSITIPASASDLGDNLFFNCAKLQHVGLPANLQKISNGMFYGCTALESVTIPTGVTEIGMGAFGGSGLTQITIPENVIRIGANAFASCVELERVHIPSGVVAIEEATFVYCVKLATVTGGSNINSIGAYAFNDCASLESIVIPAGVTAIGEDAFLGCSSLAEVYYGGTAEQWSGLTNCPAAEYVHYSCTSADNHWQAETVKVTCTTDGYTCEKCACGHERNKQTTQTAPGHSWVAATCTAPKTCSVCSATEGEALGHNWVAATCTAPKTCSVCSATEGEALGHNWVAADCDTPKTCSVCSATEGEALGHSWVAADCDTPKTCSVCSTTEGEALGHNYVDGTCSRCTAADPNYVVFGIVTQPKDVTVKSGETAATTVEARGEGLKYTWYFTSNGTATKFSKSSVTSATYSTVMDSNRDGRRIYCVVTDANGNSIRTATVTLSMEKTPLTLVSQPASVTVRGGETASATVVATGDGLSYAWYYTSNSADTTFSKSSTTTATYSTTMEASRDGRRIYCVITDAYGNSVTTETATLSMEKTPLRITQQPTSVTVVNGAPAKTTVKAEGDGLTYTWYFTSGGTATKFSKSSVTSATYSTTMSADRDGRQVYCIITDAYGQTARTETVTLSMKEAIVLVSQPQTAKVGNGETAKVTVEAEGEDLTYTWYYANKGKTTFTKSSYTTNTYATIMDSARDGRRVYCVIKDRYGNSVKTATVTMYMYTPLAITAQPVDVEVAEGITAKATVQVQGDGLTYKWYYKNADAADFTVSSIKTATYSTTMDSVRDGREVYCVITDRYGESVTTDTVTLSMKPRTPLTITQQPKDVTVAKGETASTTVVATGDGLTYAWYFTSNAADTTFSKSSTTTATYSTTMDATRDGRKVYCKITDAYGNTVKTETVTLSMETAAGGDLTVSNPPASITVGNGKTVSVIVEATGEGLSYQWYYTPNGSSSTFYASSNTTDTYTTTMDSSRDGRKIYCVVTDAKGNSVSTGIVTLNMA